MAAIRLGVAGLGTVGAGTLKLLQTHAEMIARRAGRPFLVSAVSARDRHKDRGLDLSAVRWFDDPLALAQDPDIDIVLELIGGSEGIAKDLVEGALAAGKDVITANKALLAHHGTELAKLAEDNDRCIGYEAAVAGGIPAIKTLREGLAANSYDRIFGILNGTCNYILTTMQATGREFTEVLREAQELGYAEADPGFDVDGVDAAHKLAILTALAFGCEVNFAGVNIEGIRHVTAQDFAFAKELGYRIKLLGLARRMDGGIEQRVHPALVPASSAIANVDGVFNAVVADGDFVDRVLIKGRGAGAGPTASAVVADLIDLARGVRLPTYAVPATDLAPLPSLQMERHVGCYYLRLMVVDRPGVIADVAAALRDEEISMEAMLQRGRAPGEVVPVVITTHETEETRMNRALARIAGFDAVLEAPRVIRIETI